MPDEIKAKRLVKKAKETHDLGEELIKSLKW